MGYHKVTSEEHQQIIASRHSVCPVSYPKIAEKLGIPERTVRRYANKLPVESKVVRQRPSMFDPYKEEIEEILDLIQSLRDAAATKDARFFKRLAKLDLIILDEFGYPPRDPDTIQLFFHFISDYCYEKKSLILTSNRTIKEWLSDFPEPRDEKMAHAAIDRLAQDTLLFTFLGESHRVLQSKLTDSVV